MKSMFRWTRVLAMTTLVVLLTTGLGELSREARAEDGNVDDVALPMNDPAAIELGKARFGKCSGFCHGSGGKGARAPCLICGRFKRGGKNSDLIRNIEEGVTGTAMGAFKEQLTKEEVLAVVAYLRTEQKKREAEGQ